MIFVESKAMGPTVEHGNAIIGGNCMCGCGNHRWAVGSGFLRWFGGGSSHGVSTVIPASASGGGFFETFFVFGREKLAKFDVGFVGGRAEAPHVACQSENASGFEHDGG